MPSLDKRGNGFVHLNTPASISYTPGQALTLTELTRKRDRVERVTLPASMAIWRRAFQAYTSSEGFRAMAADVEDESAGEGVILPPLAKSNAAVSAHSLFFIFPFGTRASGIPTQACGGQPTACSSVSSFDKNPLKAESDDQGHTIGPCRTSTYASFSTSHGADLITHPPGGIHIVSHHKVIGKSEFTYLDHDGILSSGVVPEVVIAPEEKAQKESERKYYISPQQMTNNEFNALEELQSLWKSKARSHSVQGAMHRATEEGYGVVPSTTSNNDNINTKNQNGGIKNCGRATGSRYQPTSPLSAHPKLGPTDARRDLPGGAASEEVLADALRMVDNLLGFA